MLGISKSYLGIPARELRRQRRARLRKARQARWRHRGKRLMRAFLAPWVVFAGALIFAHYAGGLEAGGILLTFLAMAAAFILFALFPRTRSLETRLDGEADLPELLGQTQIWLEGQRGRLPAKTRPVVDVLQNRLDELSPQLDTLRDNDPAAHELRKLLGEHVPALIGSFTSLPAALTHQPHAGSTPAAQLHAGLETVAREVETIGKAMASGELDALAIRGRYLDARYEAKDMNAEG